jgi:hypothetical protein
LYERIINEAAEKNVRPAEIFACRVKEGLEMNEKLPAATTGLILEGDPEAQLEYAKRASKALMRQIEDKPRKLIINEKRYLFFEDWQTLGSFFGGTVATEWVKPIERNGEIAGYEARAIVLARGQTISAAEASCLREEKNWAKKEEFALKSMAQTRAGGKALRNAFGWVAELGGYSTTPAEEMGAEDEMISSEIAAVYGKLDAKLANASEKGLNSLGEAWASLTPREQHLMQWAKDNRHKPRAIERNAVFGAQEVK